MLKDGLETWLHEISSASSAVARLMDRGEAEQRRAGYFHTLREICQQPLLWTDTADRALRSEREITELVEGNPGSGGRARAVVLTGSGSSLYACECVAPALQDELQLPVFCVAGGDFLTHGPLAIPPCRPCLLVSLARSGDSPESCGAADRTFQDGKTHRHLIVTCNEHGRLALNYGNLPGTFPLILHERTNDRGLVMTSSYTNLSLAARFLGMLGTAGKYRTLTEKLCAVARGLLRRYTQSLAEAAENEIALTVYLGSGCAYGAARESALKMLEISGGRVKTLAESYLGLRHGPMALIHEGTRVVCFLSSANPARAYELDLIRELDRKRLGVRKVIVGEGIPVDILREDDLAVECPGLGNLGDHGASLIDAVAGQILAFFKCLSLNLQPDSPSAGDVIRRVVEPFTLY